MFDPLPYAAYGSNLWHAQMLARCPGAEVAGSVMLPGWRLVLRKFALIEADVSASLPVGLWRVTSKHLETLDDFEGRHTYARRRIALPDGGEAWTYHEIRHRPARRRPSMWNACATAIASSASIRRRCTRRSRLPASRPEQARGLRPWARRGGAPPAPLAA